MEGLFKIKEKINGRTYYVQVCLQAEEIAQQAIEIEMRGFTTWKSAVTFAAEYFHRRYAGSDKRGLKISIQYLHDMEPDTNNMIVFYAVVQALCHAFGRQGDVAIDESGKFVVPKSSRGPAVGNLF